MVPVSWLPARLSDVSWGRKNMSSVSVPFRRLPPMSNVISSTSRLMRSSSVPVRPLLQRSRYVRTGTSYRASGSSPLGWGGVGCGMGGGGGWAWQGCQRGTVGLAPGSTGLAAHVKLLWLSSSDTRLPHSCGDARGEQFSALVKSARGACVEAVGRPRSVPRTHAVLTVVAGRLPVNWFELRSRLASWRQRVTSSALPLILLPRSDSTRSADPGPHKPRGMVPVKEFVCAQPRDARGAAGSAG
jgi:hypothetical protein